MKSSLFLAGVMLAGILTSCNLDDGVSEQTQECQLNQLIIPDDESKPVSVQNKCAYSLKMDLNAGTMKIESGSMNINGMQGTLSAGPFKYTYAYAGYGESFNFRNGSGSFASNKEVTDIKGYLTTFMDNTLNQRYGLVLGYKTNGATVKTFYPTQLFSGTTKTIYQIGPSEKTSESDDATYGISFADDMKSANVIIYNIKFAEEMPKALEAVILKNLEVTLNRDGYVISGTDIIPEVKEGSGTTPYENYPFRSFTLMPTNDDLTEARCDYVVSVQMGPASMDFSGEFVGRYATFVNSGEIGK